MTSRKRRVNRRFTHHQEYFLTLTEFKKYTLWTGSVNVPTYQWGYSTIEGI